MSIAHNLGLPRIGLNRELKKALERYWKGEITENELLQVGSTIRTENWQRQIAANHHFLSVGDFSLYDHVLDTSALLGVVPQRFAQEFTEVDLDIYFRMARGRGKTGEDTHACEMTKWFDTNYHYIVPEFSKDQQFKLSSHKLFSEILEAKKLGKAVKPIILGPLSYLWLGKVKETEFEKLDLLDNLLIAYREIFNKLRELEIEWVQIDEPILVLDLPTAWQKAFQHAYAKLTTPNLKILLATYFGGLLNNTELACHLPTAGLHVDLVRAPEKVSSLLQHLPAHKIISLGVIDGRNIWRADLHGALELIKPIHEKFKENVWIASSCSLLHSPYDLNAETKLDAEIKSWLAFATQKLHEITILSDALNQGESAIQKELDENAAILKAKQQSKRIYNQTVKNNLAQITRKMFERNNVYALRQKTQQAQLNLPCFPTTTIGSFPQTQQIRTLRQEYKSGRLDENTYREQIKTHIAETIQKQIALEIDVLVHGESERNDMVEYFGELLEGFAFTQNGWVQSYGSRCVKPPIIFGDVSRRAPMTVQWAQYAQSLTNKPVKGMLTGPITILCWSFVRDDQSRFETAKQIALALREEVDDLVKAGISIVQIDEPAIREGLPLRRADWSFYLQNAVDVFRLASSSVADNIQIHTHMCYSEFNDIIKAVADLDADVITIETSRSDMELLKAFEEFNYPNDIGPGVYDIHSPRIPTVEEMVALIEKAAVFIPVSQLWINPDCGLKTRDWLETEVALQNMVNAAKILREKYSTHKKSSLDKKSVSVPAES